MSQDEKERSALEIQSDGSFVSRAGRALQTVLILLLPGFMAVAAMLPATAMGPTAFAIRQDFAMSIAQIGVAYTAFFLASAMFAGVGGWAVGRWRTLDIIRVCLLVTAALTAGMAFSGSAEMLIIFSILTGTVNGVMTPAVNVLITRLVPLKVRGLAFGVKVAAAPLASSLAAVGAWAAANFDFPWRAIYWIGASASVLVVVGTLLLGGQHRPSAQRAKKVAVRPLSKRRQRSLLVLALGGLLGASGTGVLPPFLVDGLIDHGLDPGHAASLLAIGSGVGFVARIVVGALSDRWPRPILHLHAVGIMLTIAGVSMGLLGLGGSELVLVVSTLVFFALGWAWPGLVHYAVLATHSDSPAMATTHMQTGTFLGSVIGPLGFGLMANYGSFTLAWLIAAICVLASAALLTWGAKRLASDIGTTRVEQ